ncbi:hypothetical protein ACWKTZ_25395 [Bacillus cereus]
MLVILATLIAGIWYIFDLPNAAMVELVCVLLVVFYALAKRIIGSVLFFLGAIFLFLWALSNSLLYGIVAFFGVIFAAAWLIGASSSGGVNTGSDNNFRNERSSKPKRKTIDDGYFENNYEQRSNRKNSGIAYTNTKKQSGITEEEYRKKQAEDDAYFYRRHGGYRHKVEEADDILGRSQRERDYEDEKYETRCRGCNEPESHCRCCNDCDQYPCRCCRECGEANCRCCRRCDSYPCECCNECGEANCRCCRSCNSHPCECCDECRQPQRYCRCDR